MAFSILGFDIIFIILSYVQIFITVFQLPQKEARFKAFNTCISHICVFLQFYILGFFSFFTHRFGSHIPPYVPILLSNLYLFVSPLLNPIVYRVKTKQICDHVLTIFVSSKHLDDSWILLKRIYVNLNSNIHVLKVKYKISTPKKYFNSQMLIIEEIFNKS